MDWLGGREYQQPVWIDDACDVWPLAYKLDDDGRTWVGLMNFGHDEVNDVTCWIAGLNKAKVSYVNVEGKLQRISSRYIRTANGRIGVDLAGEHAVRPLDAQMFVVEPMM